MRLQGDSAAELFVRTCEDPAWITWIVRLSVMHIWT